MERLGEILRSVEKYSSIVDTAIQSNPLVSALVWAGIKGIMLVTLNHIEVIEGFEVAIAALLEKMSMCEFYSSIYSGVTLPSQSTVNSSQLQSMLDSALPGLYAAVIVFSVKARTYFEAKGMTNVLKPFDIEFQPFIDEINTKEGAIRQCADAATMERVRSKCNSTSRIMQNLTQKYRHRRCSPWYNIRAEAFSQVAWLVHTDFIIVTGELGVVTTTRHYNYTTSYYIKGNLTRLYKQIYQIKLLEYLKWPSKSKVSINLR